MDSLMTKVLDWIPPTWRPYIAMLLLVLYVVTKVRSMFKSADLEARCKSCPAVQLLSKIFVNRAIHKDTESQTSIVRKVIDIIF
jgi:hypothetical protein